MSKYIVKSIVKTLDSKKHATKAAMQNFYCLLVEHDGTLRALLQEYIEVADSTTCQIRALLGEREEFRHAPLTNSRNSAQLFLWHAFLSQVFLTIFLTIYFDTVFVVFFLLIC